LEEKYPDLLSMKERLSRQYRGLSGQGKTIFNNFDRSFLVLQNAWKYLEIRETAKTNTDRQIPGLWGSNR
jgi:hypothetical protein